MIKMNYAVSWNAITNLNTYKQRQTLPWFYLATRNLNILSFAQVTCDTIYMSCPCFLIRAAVKVVHKFCNIVVESGMKERLRHAPAMSSSAKAVRNMSCF